KFTAYPDGELHIRSVDFSDSHLKFRCEARNELIGKTMLSQTSGQLTVMEGRGTMAPKIFHQTTEIIGKVGDENVLLPCAAQGNPSPKYEWFKESENRKLHPLINDNRIVSLDGTLIIMRPSVADSSRYVCVASNSVGNARCELNLIIRQTLKAKINSSKPRITVISGETMQVNCSVEGYPLNVIRWRKDLKVIKEIKSDLKIRQISEKTAFNSFAIRLTSFERKDAGIYQCFAENDFESLQASVEIAFVDEGPSFDVTFAQQTLNPGNSLSLSCSANGNPLPQITWTLDEQSFPSSHRVRYGDYVTRDKKVTSFVNITNVQPEDSGLYKCIASNSVATIAHQQRVNVYGPPAVKPMRNVTALEGDSLHLYCPAYGYPIEKISWLKENNTLPASGQHSVYSNGSLLITSINRKLDEGRYTCIAENKRGNKGESSTYIKVIVGPRIDPFSFAKDLEEGMRAVAVCAVSSGDPPIRITWLKDGHALDENLRITIETLNDFSSTISFRSLSTHHSGNYTCLATNAASKDNFTAELVVKVPPFWVKEPSDTEALLGQRLVLDCQANGFPEPQIRWKRLEDNAAGKVSPFKTIISNPHIHILENGSLLINQVEHSDRGHYMCQASNTINPSLSKVIALKVNSPPRFTEKFVSKVVRKGNSLHLYCNATGNTPISYIWKKDDLSLQQIMDSTRYKVSSNGNWTMLEIKFITRLDSTLFTCTASNSYGIDEMSYRIIVQEPPEAPFNLNVQTVSSNSMTISWSQPYNGNSPLLEYDIEYKRSEELTWTYKSEKITKPATSLNVVLDNLLPSQSYNIRILCKNSLGPSNYSEILTAKTLEEPPALPPSSMEAKSTGSSSLRVSWNPPQHKSTITIKGYYVAYRVFASQSKFNFKTFEATKSNREECHINGLRKATKYEVKVQAFNSAGNGPFSDVIVAETLKFDAPKAAVVNIIKTATTSIEVEWTLEDEPITDEDSEWILKHLSAMKSFTITDLKCGTKYSVFVKAINEAGVGDPSEIVHTKTEGSAPVAPEKSAFLATNSTTVSLNLDAWHSIAQCPITSFDIHFKQQGDKEWTHFKQSDAEQTGTLVISSLHPGTWYSLLMRAVNDAGTTDAEYIFSTLLMSGATIPPLLIRSNAETSMKLPTFEKWIVEQLNFILPIQSYGVRRSNGKRYDRNLSTSVSDGEFKGENVSLPADTSVVSLKASSNIPDARLSFDQIQNLDSGDVIYYPSPYAFSRVTDYNIDTNVEMEETYKMHPINRTSSTVSSTIHNYDTPVFVKRVKQNNYRIKFTETE
ncbi:cell adhesion molecule-like protein, partial [Dinothrombium tinctorium]